MSRHCVCENDIPPDFTLQILYFAFFGKCDGHVCELVFLVEYRHLFGNPDIAIDTTLFAVISQNRNAVVLTDSHTAMCDFRLRRKRWIHRLLDDLI